MIRRLSSMLAAGAVVGVTAAVATPAFAVSGNLLRNPGFEQGDSRAWKGEECCVTTSDPHSGAWIAWMGGTGSPHTDRISQQVSIPSADDARLTFWLKVSTEEPSGNTDDTFTVKVTNASGTTRTVKSLSSADATGTYVKYSAPMKRYTGKTVTVAFVATEDQSNRSDFQLDDTALRTL